MAGLSIIALTRQATGCKHRARLVLLLTLTLLAVEKSMDWMKRPVGMYTRPPVAVAAASNFRVPASLVTMSPR